MKSASRRYKDKIREFGKELDSIITYNNGEEEEQEVKIGKAQLNNVEYNFNGGILKSVMKELKIDSNVEIPVGEIINYKFGVRVNRYKQTNDEVYIDGKDYYKILYSTYMLLEEGTDYEVGDAIDITDNIIEYEEYEYVNYGNFIVYKVEAKEDTDSYEITCYDKMLNAMKEYQPFGVSYPITVRNYLKKLCDFIQVGFANESDNFVNYDKVIDKELYLKEDGGSLNYTFRDVLDELAQVTASTICINEKDELELRYKEKPHIPKNQLNKDLGFTLGYINSQGVWTSDTKTAVFNQLIEVEAGKTYCFSMNQNVDNMVLSYYNGETFVGRQKVTNKSKVTYTVANNVNIVRWAVNYDNSSTITQEIIDSLQPMVEYGTERTEYEPYEPQTDTVNLLDVRDYDYGRYVTMSGTQERKFLVGDQYVMFYPYIELEPGVNYTYSVGRSDIGTLKFLIFYFDEYFSYVSGGTITPTKNTTRNIAYKKIKIGTGSLENVKYVRLGYYISEGVAPLDDKDYYKFLLIRDPEEIYRDDYVEYKDGPTIINERDLKDINVKFGEKYGPINSVVLSRASDSDSVYLQDASSISENGLCEIKISENQIMNGNDRSDYLPDILDELNGMEYYLNDYSSPGISYLDLMDSYKVNIDSNEYDCIMFNDELNVSQGLEENIYTELPKETKTDYTKADKTDRRINQTYIIADKQKGEIEALVSAIETVEDELGNVYTKDQVEQLLINSETGVTNTFAEAGGNNIFRNTGLWFENDDLNTQGQNPYEFWNGLVVRESEDKASNHNALLLQNNSLWQEQTVPNGNYTVSFKYNKIYPLSTVKVKINDKEYELSGEGEQEFCTGIKDENGEWIIEPVIISSQDIKVEFTSNMDGACKIYDLMVNAGSVKLAYSQNQNETTTDTVNISKGITITSSDYSTTFKANADGIRTLDRSGGELAKFTDKGMNTKEMVVREKGQISGVLIQPVGNQTWFTKI